MRWMARQPTRRGLLGINLDGAQGEISLPPLSPAHYERVSQLALIWLAAVVARGCSNWQLRRPVPPAMHSTPMQLSAAQTLGRDRPLALLRSQLLMLVPGIAEESVVLALRGRTWLRAGMCYRQGCAALGPPEPEPSTQMQLSLRAIRSPIKVTR